ncbi:acyl-CoA carboxylase epsilon subunit [Amycolatopsis silviterrae]|uniref:Acyl-CoA carboxylase epsilon subunit n=1 Tax=Amycolatopsis silviterrae TaxID=1656914 RepID=A0ABW5HN60_9PSEU
MRGGVAGVPVGSDTASAGLLALEETAGVPGGSGADGVLLLAEQGEAAEALRGSDADGTKLPVTQGKPTEETLAEGHRDTAVVPAVRVVRGNPDDVEVAALLVALAAVGQGTGNGRGEIAVPSPRQPSTRFVPATSWRAR